MDELLENRLSFYIESNDGNREKALEELMIDLYTEGNIKQDKISKLRDYFYNRMDNEYSEVFENQVDTIIFFMNELGIE